MFRDDEAPQHLRNPYFTDKHPISIWNRFPYFARFKGLSVEDWLEMLAFLSDNARGQYEHYEARPFHMRGVKFMDEVDYLYFKLKFHGDV